MKILRYAVLVAAALFTLVASAAGAFAASIEGTYADKDGITKLEFKNARVTITRLGIMQGIFKYTVDGKEITVSNANNGQAMLLEINDKGCIIGVPGASELCKVGAGSSAGAANTGAGVSGVYAGNDPKGNSYRFDFHGDGTVGMTTEGINVTATYKVTGRTVTITAPKAAGGDTLVLQIDDAGCLTGPDVGKLCKVAESGDTGSSSANTSGVWGVYSTTDPTNGTIRWTFYNDGKVEMSAQGASFTATYKAEGKKVTITAPKSVGGDVIVMQMDDKGCLYNPDQPTTKLCKE